MLEKKDKHPEIRIRGKVESRLEGHVLGILQELGINTMDPNFRETPQRVAKFYREMCKRERPVIKTFPSVSKEMVVLKNFVAYSLCPHHLLPVRYTFRVGYIPSGYVLGISKMPRLINYIMRQLPLQEDIPDMVVNELETLLRPIGAGCQVVGRHLCMEMRGVRTEGEFVTTKLSGVILLNPGTHEEFLHC
jgi:GTP cyclohydrolase IA